MVGFQAEEEEESSLPVRRVSRLRAWRKIDPDDEDYDPGHFDLPSHSHHDRMDGKMAAEHGQGHGKAISGSGCGLEVIDRGLTRLFYWLGVKIGEHPSYYIIIPLFISLLLGTGMQRLIYVDDPEYLFSPVDGLGKYERELIETQFPMNYSARFNPSRFVRPGRFAR
jgi:hypothetical protein